ncbi:hypothetical protein [Arsenicibacter rosenii]|uniref:Uncharacterized protein n=1 Tax=Arsenicibacter rosenii TaxID=1750698 RepID=A0A1S2VEZ7_9BACT|nr:hypothetical protein [Arsenicibacter rosenii]OIN56776.1 hypothetical protein BLX24_22635 [Arsenicibacter rosenii]
MRALLLIGWLSGLILFTLLELRAPDHPAAALPPQTRLYAPADAGPDLYCHVSDRITVRFGQLVDNLMPLDSVIHRSPCAVIIQPGYTSYRPRSQVANPDSALTDTRKRRWVEMPDDSPQLT